MGFNLATDKRVALNASGSCYLKDVSSQDHDTDGYTRFSTDVTYSLYTRGDEHSPRVVNNKEVAAYCLELINKEKNPYQATVCCEHLTENSYIGMFEIATEHKIGIYP